MKAHEPASRQLQLTVGALILTATLYDSLTTHDFIALLALDLTLEDYAGTEKISDLPKRLSTAAAHGFLIVMGRRIEQAVAHAQRFGHATSAFLRIGYLVHPEAWQGHLLPLFNLVVCMVVFSR